MAASFFILVSFFRMVSFLICLLESLLERVCFRYVRLRGFLYFIYGFSCHTTRICNKIFCIINHITNHITSLIFKMIFQFSRRSIARNLSAKVPERLTVLESLRKIRAFIGCAHNATEQTTPSAIRAAALPLQATDAASSAKRAGCTAGTVIFPPEQALTHHSTDAGRHSSHTATCCTTDHIRSGPDTAMTSCRTRPRCLERALSSALGNACHACGSYSTCLYCGMRDVPCHLSHAGSIEGGLTADEALCESRNLFGNEIQQDADHDHLQQQGEVADDAIIRCCLLRKFLAVLREDGTAHRLDEGDDAVFDREAEHRRQGGLEEEFRLLESAPGNHDDGDHGKRDELDARHDDLKSCEEQEDDHGDERDEGCEARNGIEGREDALVHRREEHLAGNADDVVRRLCRSEAACRVADPLESFHEGPHEVHACALRCAVDDYVPVEPVHDEEQVQSRREQGFDEEFHLVAGDHAECDFDAAIDSGEADQELASNRHDDASTFLAKVFVFPCEVAREVVPFAVVACQVELIAERRRRAHRRVNDKDVLHDEEEVERKPDAEHGVPEQLVRGFDVERDHETAEYDEDGGDDTGNGDDALGDFLQVRLERCA